MLRSGMAEVYESGGAEYGPWGLERLKQIEAEAKYVPSAYRLYLSCTNMMTPDSLSEGSGALTTLSRPGITKSGIESGRMRRGRRLMGRGSRQLVVRDSGVGYVVGIGARCDYTFMETHQR